MLYHECLISEWIALYVPEIPQHFFSSDISSLPAVIPMTGLFAPHISSAVSKVIWGDKEVNAGAICWSGSSCPSFRENSGSSDKNECKTVDQGTDYCGHPDDEKQILESQNQTRTTVIERKEYIDPLFWGTVLCWWKDKLSLTFSGFINLVEVIQRACKE